MLLAAWRSPWAPWMAAALLALVIAGVWAWQRQRSNAKGRRKRRHHRAASQFDTSASYRLSLPPDRSVPLRTGPALTALEQIAFDLLAETFPRARVMTHVPLGRFILLPAREQRPEWLQRVGCLEADLLLCDEMWRVLAVIDVRSGHDSAQSIALTERMARVAQEAGLPVLVWRESQFPSAEELRASLLSMSTVAPALARLAVPAVAASASGPPSPSIRPRSSPQLTEDPSLTTLERALIRSRSGNAPASAAAS